MISRQSTPPHLPARLPSPPQPGLPENQPTQPPAGRGDVFFQSSASCARTLAKVGGFTNGASLGYLAGALAGATAGASGPVAWAVAVVGAGGGGVAGWKIMGKVSDLAALGAVRLDPKHPLRAEAAGRAALNLGVDLLSGSPITAAVDLSVTAGWGLYSSIRVPKNRP